MLEDLLPMDPANGPPLPRCLGIKWPATDESAQVGLKYQGATVWDIPIQRLSYGQTYQRRVKVNA